MFPVETISAKMLDYYVGRRDTLIIDLREKGIKDVVFDRGGFIYQGKVQALADAAREAGLNF